METHNFNLSSLGKIFPVSTYKHFTSYFGNDGRHVEPNTRRWFSDNIQKNDIVFDIGANIGLYTILFSQLTDNTFSFEPTETYGTFLIPNLERNGINNVKTFKLAISNKSGIFDEKIYMVWGQEPVFEKFEFTTIDEFVEGNDIIPKYMKIDVDVFDLEALQGSINTLKKNDIVLCVEVNHALHTRGYKESDINDFMISVGYEHFMTLDNENFFFRKKI